MDVEMLVARREREGLGEGGAAAAWKGDATWGLGRGWFVFFS